MKWYITVLKKYADFNGRARRKEYWMFLLLSSIISFVLGFVLAMLGHLTGIGSSLANIVNVLYSLAILVPSIAVAIRRMHDIGRRGWWILVPVVNIIFLFLDSQPHENQYGPNPKALVSS